MERSHVDPLGTGARRYDVDPCEPLNDRSRFVSVAREMKFFSAHGVIYDRIRRAVSSQGLGRGMAGGFGRQYRPSPGHAGVASIASGQGAQGPDVGPGGAVPARRSQTVAAARGIMSDTEKTAPALQSVAYMAINADPPPPPLQDQTVGQVASQFVQFWLMHAGHRPQDFMVYWAARKDRTFCATWFHARLVRIVQNTMPLDKGRARAIRVLPQRPGPPAAA